MTHSWGPDCASKAPRSLWNRAPAPPASFDALRPASKEKADRQQGPRQVRQWGALGRRCRDRHQPANSCPDLPPATRAPEDVSSLGREDDVFAARSRRITADDPADQIPDAAHDVRCPLRFHQDGANRRGAEGRSIVVESGRAEEIEHDQRSTELERKVIRETHPGRLRRNERRASAGIDGPAGARGRQLDRHLVVARHRRGEQRRNQRNRSRHPPQVPDFQCGSDGSLLPPRCQEPRRRMQGWR